MELSFSLIFERKMTSEVLRTAKENMTRGKNKKNKQKQTNKDRDGKYC